MSGLQPLSRGEVVPVRAPGLCTRSVAAAANIGHYAVHFHWTSGHWH